MKKDDAVDAQAERLGGIEGIIGRGLGDFEQAVHFVDDAAAQADADFLPDERNVSRGADFLDDEVFGDGGVGIGGVGIGGVGISGVGIAGGVVRESVDEKKFLLRGAVARGAGLGHGVAGRRSGDIFNWLGDSVRANLLGKITFLKRTVSLAIQLLAHRKTRPFERSFRCRAAQFKGGKWSSPVHNLNPFTRLE